MEEQVYADDVGAIIVSGPIVRFDLMIQSATEKDAQGKPKFVVQQRVITRSMWGHSEDGRYSAGAEACWRGQRGRGNPPKK